MSSESVVDLNVGGLLYTTSIGTLTKVGTFFTHLKDHVTSRQKTRDQTLFVII